MTTPTVREIFLVAVLNGAAECSLSWIHNVLFFMLGLSQWVLHCAHYALAFIIICLYLATRNKTKIQQNNYYSKDYWKFAAIPLVATGILSSSVSAAFHVGGLSLVGLHQIRMADSLVTIALVVINRRSSLAATRTLPILVTAIMYFAMWSLDSNVVHTAWTLLCVMLLAAAQSIHFQVFQHQLRKIGTTIPEFICIPLGLIACGLVPGAVFSRIDLFPDKNFHSEIVDVGLILVGIICSFPMTYSNYWLNANLSLEVFLMSRHAKYILAYYGQMITTNLAYVTVSSATSCFIATLALFVYFHSLRSDTTRELDIKGKKEHSVKGEHLNGLIESPLWKHGSEAIGNASSLAVV